MKRKSAIFSILLVFTLIATGIWMKGCLAVDRCLDRAKKFVKIGNAGTMYRVVMAQSVDMLKLGLARPGNAT